MSKWHGNIKCGCGHTQKDHWAGWGWCHHSEHPKAGQCGCTWFYPSDYYILKLKPMIRETEKKCANCVHHDKDEDLSQCICCCAEECVDYSEWILDETVIEKILDYPDND